MACINYRRKLKFWISREFWKAHFKQDFFFARNSIRIRLDIWSYNLELLFLLYYFTCLHAKPFRHKFIVVEFVSWYFSISDHTVCNCWFIIIILVYHLDTGFCHSDTDFSWFPCVYKRMLRWFPSFPVATTCLSCSPPDLNFLVTCPPPTPIFVYM